MERITPRRAHPARPYLFQLQILELRVDVFGHRAEKKVSHLGGENGVRLEDAAVGVEDLQRGRRR